MASLQLNLVNLKDLLHTNNRLVIRSHNIGAEVSY